jgi:hypothetical protein
MNYLTEKVARLEPAGGHRLAVTFRDGFEATVDLAPLLDEGPIFAPWRDEHFFASVRLERGVPVWSDELDLSPGSLRAWCEAGRVLSVAETDVWVVAHAGAESAIVREEPPA